MRMKEEIWADADGNAVPFNDERGRTVLFGEGAQITDAQAEKYGIKRGRLGGEESQDEAEGGEPGPGPDTAPDTAPAVNTAPAESVSGRGARHGRRRASEG